MVLARALVVAPFLLALHLLVGCATTGNRTPAAADRLQSAADAFAGRSSDSSLTIAQGFSDEAHEFRRTLDTGASERDVLLAYERLWRRYHMLGYEVSRSRDPGLQSDWSPVRTAFADVQKQVRVWYSHADPTLYGRGGYVLDPYYN